MTTTRPVCLCLALTLIACGGGKDEPRGNQAAGTPFTYGGSQPASAEQAGSMGNAVASMGSLGTAPGAAGALGSSDTGTVADALMGPSAVGSTGVSFSGPVTFDVPTCATVTPTSVSFSGCRVTVSQTGGGNTTSAVMTLSGGASRAASGNGASWDLTLGVDLNMTGQQSVAASVRTHRAGNVEVTDAIAKGSATAENSVTATVNGQSISAAFDESLAFDLTHSASCATRVTGGTLEAKRVWVTRPSGATPAQLPDEAVKITWTACGVATVQIGVR